MSVKVLLVKTAYEALCYKKRYSTLLDGAKVVFADDERRELRLKNIHVMYYTNEVPSDCPVFGYLKGAVPPVMLAPVMLFR